MDKMYENINKKLEMEIVEKMVKAEIIITMREVRRFLPIKTGKLRFEAFTLRETSEGYEVYLDQLIAPYIKYPNLKAKLDVIWPALVESFAQRLAVRLDSYLE